MYFRLAQDSYICILRAKLPQLRHNTPDLGWRAKEGSGLAGSAGKKKNEGASDSRPLGVEPDGRRSGSPPALAPVPFQEIRYVVFKSRPRVREWHELTMTFPRLSFAPGLPVCRSRASVRTQRRHRFSALSTLSRRRKFFSLRFSLVRTTHLTRSSFAATYPLLYL